MVEIDSHGNRVFRYAKRESGFREVEISAAVEAFEELDNSLEAGAQVHRWVAGDVLLLDNFRVVHGRQAIEEHCNRHLLRLAFT